MRQGQGRGEERRGEAVQDRVSTFSKVCAESQTADRSLNCTISLYKCSVITFITLKDQPVTSVERNPTNDSPDRARDIQQTFYLSLGDIHHRGGINVWSCGEG